MLVQILNLRFYDWTRYTQTLGFPAIDNSGYSFFVGHNLSSYSNKRISRYRGKFDSYIKRFEKPNRKISNLLAVVGVMLAVVAGVLLFPELDKVVNSSQGLLAVFAYVLLLTILVISPNQLWALKTIHQMKSDLPAMQKKVRAKLDEIYQDNDADLELSTMVPKWLQQFQATLSDDGLACNPAQRVTAGDDCSWRVVDVQASGTGSLTGRDVTIFVSNDHGEGRTLIQPSRDTVETWFKDQLARMRVGVREGTHTMAAIKAVDASEVLAVAWQFPDDVMTEAARLKAMTEMKLSERPAVEIYGQACDEGQILVSGIAYADREVLYAPTQTVLALAGVVASHLSSVGDHPALEGKIAA